MTTNEYGLAYQKGFQPTTQILRARGLDHLRAEEVAQAAWCLGYQRIYQLRDAKAVYDWINTIALNLVRSDKRRTPLCQLLPVYDTITSSTINEFAVDVDRLLQFCRPHQRRVLECRYLEGYSPEEMARLFGISTAAIDQRVSRALGSIRRAVGCESHELLRKEKPCRTKKQ